MKVFFVIIMLVLAGCAASSTRSIQERSVLGSFCHSSIDASLCLELKEDHRYAETFSGGGVILLGPNGEIPKASPEPRGSGRWELRSNEVVLLPVQGPRRILQLSEIRGAVVLLERKSGKVIREYRR